MSQESVNEVRHNPPQGASSMEGVLVQITNELQIIRQEISGIHARMDHMEQARSAPPIMGAPRLQTNPPPPPPPFSRDFQPRHPYVPQPIPPYRGGQGGRGQGRSTPMTRLQEQIQGATNREGSRDGFEEDFGEFDGRQAPRGQQARNQDQREHYQEEANDQDPFEDRYGPRRPPRPHNPRDRYHEDDYDYYGDEYEPRRPPRNYPPRGRRYEEEDEFKDVKINIPSFNGSRNPEIYLEWERKVDLAFEFREYSERNKLKLITQEFNGYALTWWDDMHKKRERNNERTISTWIELKREMRARFVPQNYERELHQKLQWLIQGSKSVGEYYEEMQALMLKIDLEEREEAIMARFTRGLNRDIYNVVELQPYNNMDELLDKATKVERQLRSTKFKGASSSTPQQRPIWNKSGEASKNPQEVQKGNKAENPQFKPYNRPPSNTRPNQPPTQQSKYPPSFPTKSKEVVTCFKCQGKGHYARE